MSTQKTPYDARIAALENADALSDLSKELLVMEYDRQYTYRRALTDHAAAINACAPDGPVARLLEVVATEERGLRKDPCFCGFCGEPTPFHSHDCPISLSNEVREALGISEGTR